MLSRWLKRFEEYVLNKENRRMEREIEFRTQITDVPLVISFEVLLDQTQELIIQDLCITDYDNKSVSFADLSPDDQELVWTLIRNDVKRISPSDFDPEFEPLDEYRAEG